VKASCLQENLAQGLGIVSRAVSAASTLPILGHVRLQAADGRLELTGTNLEIGIRTWIEAEVRQEGATTVPARLLGDLVGALPHEPVELELDTRTETLNVRCARYRSNIKGISAQDFPLVPTGSANPTLCIEPGLLRSMINQVAFAASGDDSRPILTGVLTRLHGDTLTMATADGFRLSVRDERFEVAAEADLEVVIPAKALGELARLLGGVKDPVEITAAPNQVIFRAGSSELATRLIEGHFPNYTQIVPTSYDVRAEMPVEDLRRAARVAALFAQGGTPTVLLTLEPGADLTAGRAILTAGDDQVGDNQNTVPAVITGGNGPARVAFNVKFLKELLAAVQAKEIALEMTTATAPVSWKAVGEDGFLHVIMPMHVGGVR